MAGGSRGPGRRATCRSRRTSSGICEAVRDTGKELGSAKASSPSSFRSNDRDGVRRTSPHRRPASGARGSVASAGVLPALSLRFRSRAAVRRPACAACRPLHRAWASPRLSPRADPVSAPSGAAPSPGPAAGRASGCSTAPAPGLDGSHRPGGPAMRNKPLHVFDRRHRDHQQPRPAAAGPEPALCVVRPRPMPAEAGRGRLRAPAPPSATARPRRRQWPAAPSSIRQNTVPPAPSRTPCPIVVRMRRRARTSGPCSTRTTRMMFQVSPRPLR